MKLLAIGDFHGKFPEKLKKRIEKEKIDLIVSIGDYIPFCYRKLWFKHCYGKDIELWEIIGKAKYKRLVIKDLKIGDSVLKNLNKLSIPIISIVGNLDYPGYIDTQDSRVINTRKRIWKWDNQDFLNKLLKKYKKIKRFDYNYTKFNNLIFIGGFGHSNPGDIKSKTHKKYLKRLDNLFKKFKKENKKRKVIFVFHNMPYNCKLDLIRDKKADKRARYKHYGSKLTRKIIDKYQPILGIGGHMHENQGKCKINRTLVINTGGAYEGKAAIIEFNEKKGKIMSTRFIK